MLCYYHTESQLRQSSQKSSFSAAYRSLFIGKCFVHDRDSSDGFVQVFLTQNTYCIPHTDMVSVQYGNVCVQLR
jgi:hypothetical protein